MKKQEQKGVIPSLHSHPAYAFFAFSLLIHSLRLHVKSISGRYTNDMLALVVYIGSVGSVASDTLYTLMYGNHGSTSRRAFVRRLQTLREYGLVVKKWSRGAYRYSLSPLCLRMVRESVGREALRSMHAIVKDALK